mgnify:CR=1 FL=1
MLLTVREFEVQRLQERSWILVRISLIKVALLTVELKLFPFGNYVILVVCYTPDVLYFKQVSCCDGKLLLLGNYTHFDYVLVAYFKINFELFFIDISFHKDEGLVIG